MTADVDTGRAAAGPVSPSSRRASAAGQNGAVPVDLHELPQALEAVRGGASDYLASPVNTEQLFSALRLCLHR